MTTSLDEITRLSAVEIAAAIRSGTHSAVEVCEAFIRQIQRTHDQLNAVVVPRFEQARADAKRLDQFQQSGGQLGPLHGVPMTVKECFHVAGLPSTIGLTHRTENLESESALLVRRLQDAGAVLLGKTNIPQLMIWHECDNPVYGRTNNPWDLDRSPGGSTGGEAAIIAAGGSPLGIGNDLGGSIRLPAHFCGVHGIKPTSGRLPRGGAVRNFRGMEAMVTQPGPLARKVDDLWLGLSVLARTADGADEVPPLELPDPAAVDVKQLTIGYFVDDGFFPPCPAIRRLVKEAAESLAELGCRVVEIEPPDIEEMVAIYFGIMSADGGADLIRMARGSVLDRRVAHMLRLTKMPRVLRRSIQSLLGLQGQRRLRRLLAFGGARTANEYWQLTHRRSLYTANFRRFLRDQQVDACVCPPHGLPAMVHRKPVDLFDAASYAFLGNVTGLPAGVVSIGRVAEGEESDRPDSRDLVERRAKQVEANSAGLPIGVQVLADHWREDLVLAVMKELEYQFRSRPDYPCVDAALAGLQ